MSEVEESKRDGATLVPNSGRSRGTAKGDATLDNWLIDYKEYSKSYGVSVKAWSKLQSDSWKNGHRNPTLKLVLGDDGKYVRLFVIDEKMFHEMHEAWKVVHEQV